MTAPDPEFHVTKATHWVHVNVRDGTPCCPCHDEPMTPIVDGWRCQFGLALEQLLRDRLVEQLLRDRLAEQGPDRQEAR